MARPDGPPAANQPPVGDPQTGYPPPDHQQQGQQPKGKPHPQVVYPPPQADHQPQMYHDPPPPPPPQPQQTGYPGVQIINTSQYYTQAPMAMPMTGAVPDVSTPPLPLGLPVHQQAATEAWSSGLFGCFDDPVNAIVTICFPCVTFGQVAEILDNGATSCTVSAMLYCLIANFIGCPCILSCTYRSKLRIRYGLMESPAPDFLTHCFCEWCALCQEYRELRSRDLDPAIGWQGNLARQQKRNMQMQQQACMTPPMNQTMMG